MTEAAPNYSFGKYLAAKRAVSAYGLSEEFEENQLFTMASSNATLQLPKLSLSDALVPLDQVLQTVYTIGTGKRWVTLSPFKGAVAASITSGTPESLFTVTHSAGMASEPPVITEEQSIDEIIRRIRTTLPDRYGQKLAARVTELDQAVKEEEPDGRGIEVRSLCHFVNLLKAYPTLRCPTVSVTPDRNIYASWNAGRERVFSVHFLPDGRVRFVIFYPNNKHPGDVIRVSGVATVDVVINVVAPHGILNWARE